MARLVDERKVIYGAADMWKHECLLADGSVFGAGRLWSPDRIAELITNFVDKPDTGDRTFEEKLHDQLAGASRDARKLAAEMLWVMMLFPNNVKKERKLELIRTVWEWSGDPLPDPNGVLGVLSLGIGSGGMGYNNYRPFELMLLVRFAQAWKAISDGERERLIGDPWQFAAWFDRLPDATSRQLRHMLLHLLFPDTFERISSKNDKKRVDAAFSPRLKDVALDLTDRGPSSLARDRRIWHVRRILEAERPGEWIDFYETRALASVWRESKDGEPKRVEEPTPRAPYSPGPRRWAIGAAAGAARWPAFLDDGVIAIGWDEIGDLSKYKSVDEVRLALVNSYDREQHPINDGLACFQFCHEMREGDEVFVKQGLNRILGYGKIIGPYEHEESRPDFRNIRKVEWLRRGNWTLPDSAQLPSKTLTDVSNYPAFQSFMRSQLEMGTPAVDEPPPFGVDDFMGETFYSRETIDRILENLRRRKNVILQGPPGVGKTFLSRRLAYALIGAKSPDNVQMVQFHQSYAYEDFIQGWRPNGQGGFTLRNGVFHQFCERAQSRPGQPHVFIIDEINRGNLSKVFGELLGLIEADKRGPEFAIPLTYSESATDTFFVPDNLFIIGLMNTADRSLAMVDFALRRRFAFVTVEPAYESPKFREALLDKGVQESTIDHIIEAIGEVNSRIIADARSLGPGFAIGHSYFCPTSKVVDSREWFSAIVQNEVAPLLQEYWFDNESQVEECLKVLKE